MIFIEFFDANGIPGNETLNSAATLDFMKISAKIRLRRWENRKLLEIRERSFLKLT
jgi:hypothetical protein